MDSSVVPLASSLVRVWAPPLGGVSGRQKYEERRVARFGARLAKRLTSFRRVISHERIRDLNCPAAQLGHARQAPPRCAAVQLDGRDGGRLFRAVEVWPCDSTTTRAISGALHHEASALCPPHWHILAFASSVGNAWARSPNLSGASISTRRTLDYSTLTDSLCPSAF